MIEQLKSLAQDWLAEGPSYSNINVCFLYSYILIYVTKNDSKMQPEKNINFNELFMT